MSLKAKTQGVVRKTSQIEKLEKDIEDIYLDDLGRQLVRYQVRDLIHTATATLANGTKTVLSAGTAGSYLDLYQISCANDSSVATEVGVFDDGTLVRTIGVPANSTTHINFQIPLKQSATGCPWYVDIPDITGTTVIVDADFTREV